MTVQYFQFSENVTVLFKCIPVHHQPQNIDQNHGVTLNRKTSLHRICNLDEYFSTVMGSSIKVVIKNLKNLFLLGQPSFLTYSVHGVLTRLIFTLSSVQNYISLTHEFDFRSPTRSRTIGPRTEKSPTCRRPLCPSALPGDVTTSLLSGSPTTTHPHPLKVYPSCDLASCFRTTISILEALLIIMQAEVKVVGLLDVVYDLPKKLPCRNCLLRRFQLDFYV